MSKALIWLRPEDRYAAPGSILSLLPLETYIMFSANVEVTNVRVLWSLLYIPVTTVVFSRLAVPVSRS